MYMTTAHWFDEEPRQQYAYAAWYASMQTQNEAAEKALSALCKRLDTGEPYDEGTELFKVLRRLSDANQAHMRKANQGYGGEAEAEVIAAESKKAAALILK
jgi:hypothetical protein